MRARPGLIVGVLIAGCGGGTSAEDAGLDATRTLVDASPLEDASASEDASPSRDGAHDDDGATSFDAATRARCDGTEGAPSVTGVTLRTIDAVPIRDGFAPGWGILEGPVWIGDALLVSHFGSGATPTSRLYRIDADGAVTLAREDAGTNGLALGPGGALYGASHALGAIVRFDLRDLAAAPVPIVASYDGARFDGPNDLVVRSDGAIYFTDPDYQAPSPRPQRATRVYRYLADGSLQVIAEDLSQPNGIALSLDERTLFVGHARGLVRYPLDASGAVSGPRVSVDAITGGVDGLGRDCAGDLYVTTNGSVVVLRPDGSELARLAAPGATNVAFGGSDGRTLYVSALGDPPTLRTASLDVAGLPD